MPNRLAHATSPYLLQHEDNPVDWWEWGPDAFDEARERDVPILLSIGYAACHWCHVMAHESFEDPETAEMMNERFVNVKVDREERPDVDSIYMEAVQTMTGHGGWPMTVWLDHEGRPFFAGTYFPPTPRHGMASFRQVCDAITTAWSENRDGVTDQARRLTEAISGSIPPGSPPDDNRVRTAVQGILSTFDPVNGGFGSAPKFPQQPVLELLLRTVDQDWGGGRALGVTLDKMALGGLNDHLAGGFARYSVDPAWVVPHFEKMLYDNAQLARIYMWAGIELGRDEFVDVARATLSYLATDMTSPDGAFYSSEDADSEGVEGKFYVWSLSEVTDLLGDLADVAIDHYGITERGNFEGSNILVRSSHERPHGLDEADRLLLAARNERIRPGLDDKVVAEWNGLAVRAFAEAGAALRDPALVSAAAAAAEFVSGHLVIDGVLHRAWRDGRTSGPGFLEDYAGMAVGLFSLYAATGDVTWFDRAMELVEDFRRFEGPDGRLHVTPGDGEELIKRPIDMTDNPSPSGHGLAAEALMFAGLYSGRFDLLERSREVLGAAGLLMERYPSMVAHHLSVAFSLGRSREVAIVGPETEQLERAFWSRFRPESALAVAAEQRVTPALLSNRGSPETTLAYVCERFVCARPATEPEELIEQLG